MYRRLPHGKLIGINRGGAAGAAGLEIQRTFIGMRRKSVYPSHGGASPHFSTWRSPVGAVSSISRHREKEVWVLFPEGKEMQL